MLPPPHTSVSSAASTSTEEMTETPPPLPPSHEASCSTLPSEKLSLVPPSVVQGAHRCVCNSVRLSCVWIRPGQACTSGVLGGGSLKTPVDMYLLVYYVYMTYLTRCHVVIERPRSWTASDGLHLHYSWREVRYVLAQQHRCSLVLVGTVPQVHV